MRENCTYGSVRGSRQSLHDINILKGVSRLSTRLIFVIGERLKKVRKEKGMKQEELAEILGLKKSTISLYESNKYDPSDSAKLKIARCFDVSLDYLLGVIDTSVPYYRKERFLILPDDISETDINLASDFVEFIHNRSMKRANELQS